MIDSFKTQIDELDPKQAGNHKVKFFIESKIPANECTKVALSSYVIDPSLIYELDANYRVSRFVSDVPVLIMKDQYGTTTTN